MQNEINNRNFVRKTTGNFLSEEAETFTSEIYYWQKDFSTFRTAPLLGHLRRYSVCTTLSQWDSSIPTVVQSQFTNEQFANCTYLMEDSVSRQLIPLTPANESEAETPLAALAWIYSPLYNRSLELALNNPDKFNSTFYAFGVTATNQEDINGNLHLAYVLILGDLVEHPFAALPQFSFRGYSELLYHSLPSGSETKGGRAFLVAPDGRSVIAASHGKTSDRYNVSAGDVLPQRRDCIARFSTAADYTCLYNISEHDGYRLLRIAGADMIDVDNIENNDTFFSVARTLFHEDSTSLIDNYMWARSIIDFSAQVRFFLYVFVPLEVYLAEVESSRNRTIMVIVGWLFIGIIVEYLLISTVTKRMENLAELMAEDPFGDKTKLMLLESTIFQTPSEEAIENNHNHNHNHNHNSGHHHHHHSDEFGSTASKDNSGGNEESLKNDTDNNKKNAGDPSSPNNNKNNNSNKNQHQQQQQQQETRSHPCWATEEITSVEVCFLQMHKWIDEIRKFMPRSEAELIGARGGGGGGMGSLRTSTPGDSSITSLSLSTSSTGLTPHDDTPGGRSDTNKRFSNSKKRRVFGNNAVLATILQSPQPTEATSILKKASSVDKNYLGRGSASAVEQQSSGDNTTAASVNQNGLSSSTSLGHNNNSASGTAKRRGKKNVSFDPAAAEEHSGGALPASPLRVKRPVSPDLQRNKNDDENNNSDNKPNDTTNNNNNTNNSSNGTVPAPSSSSADENVMTLPHQAPDTEESPTSTSQTHAVQRFSEEKTKETNGDEDDDQHHFHSEDKEELGGEEHDAVDSERQQEEQDDIKIVSGSAASSTGTDIMSDRENTSESRGSRRTYPQQQQQQYSSSSSSAAAASVAKRKTIGEEAQLFMVAVVRVRFPEDYDKTPQSLISTLRFVVETMDSLVIQPLGVHLIEYRNDFFLLSLRLSSKRTSSALAIRFMQRLVKVSEALRDKFLGMEKENSSDEKQKTGKENNDDEEEENESVEKQEEKASRLPPPVYLTAGISLQYAYGFRVPYGRKEFAPVSSDEQEAEKKKKAEARRKKESATRSNIHNEEADEDDVEDAEEGEEDAVIDNTLLSIVRPLSILGIVFGNAIRQERIIHNLIFGTHQRRRRQQQQQLSVVKSPTSNSTNSKQYESTNNKTNSRVRLAQLLMSKLDPRVIQILRDRYRFSHLPLPHAICFDKATHHAFHFAAILIQREDVLRGMQRSSFFPNVALNAANNNNSNKPPSAMDVVTTKQPLPDGLAVAPILVRLLSAHQQDAVEVQLLQQHNFQQQQKAAAEKNKKKQTGGSKSGSSSVAQGEDAARGSDTGTTTTTATSSTLEEEGSNNQNGKKVFVPKVADFSLPSVVLDTKSAAVVCRGKYTFQKPKTNAAVAAASSSESEPITQFAVKSFEGEMGQ